MSLTDILEKISNDYKLEAEKLKEELKISREEIQGKNSEVLKSKKEELKAFYKNKEEKTLEKAASQWTLDWKDELLRAKHKKLVDLFSSVRWKVINSNKTKEVLVAILKKVEETEGSVVPFKGWAKLVKEALWESGKKFELAEEWNFKWWIKVITKICEYDFSIDYLIEKFRKNRELEISEKLFS